MFRLGGQTFVTALDNVREIVRLSGLTSLPGATPPLAGVVTLRGKPLPVLDVRDDAAAAARSDVLVVTLGGSDVGIAVDEVVAVVSTDELEDAGDAAAVLPSYVVGVRRYREQPVFVVDLRALLDGTAADWSSALTGVSVR